VIISDGTSSNIIAQSNLSFNGSVLTVSGNVVLGGSVSSNLLQFRGTTGDPNSNHTVIAERIYQATEKSELVLFKGNDTGSVSGPDRIRLRAAEHRFQTYAGGAEDWSTLQDNNDRLTIVEGGNIGIRTVAPQYELDISGQGSAINIGGVAPTPGNDGLLIQGFSNQGFIRPLASGGILYLGASNVSSLIVTASGISARTSLDVCGTSISPSYIRSALYSRVPIVNITSGTNLTINNVDASSGTHYNISNSTMTTITLPSSTTTAQGGTFWVFRNNSPGILSLTLANNANLPSNIGLPAGNSLTIAVSSNANNTFILL
jgi:hypothetical protein